MAQKSINYLNFDVEIEKDEGVDQFRVRVLDSPTGEATSTFTLPFSDLEIENFLLRIGQPREGVRRLDTSSLGSVKKFGARLFDAVFAGDVRACLHSSMDEAERRERGVRLRLRLNTAPALADLPWEFLYNARVNRFLSLSTETPVVRYLDLPERIRPLAVKPPLRVLVMISSPEDHPGLDVEREWKLLKDALADREDRGLVSVHRLRKATMAELQRELRRNEYHVFHFIGHGGFDSGSQDGVLVLEDDLRRGKEVSAQYIGAILRDEKSLRLAILNACEGARTGREDPFAGTAQSLVQQGIPAVIAMQFQVTDEAALTFTQEFYAALSEGYPVDAALAEVRKMLFAHGNEVEWGTPVLYMRTGDGQIFDISGVPEHPELEQLRAEAIGAATARNWERAEQLLAQYLNHAPHDAQAVTLLEVARAARQPDRRAGTRERITDPPAGGDDRPPPPPPPPVKRGWRRLAAAGAAGAVATAAVVALLLGGPRRETSPDGNLKHELTISRGAPEITDGAEVQRVKEDLIELVRAADSAAIDAYQNGDDRLLAGYFVGPRLERHREIMKAMREAGHYRSSQILSRDVGAFHLWPDSATLAISEERTNEVRQRETHECVGTTEPFRIQQVVHFTRERSGWRISQVKFPRGGAPALGECMETSGEVADAADPLTTLDPLDSTDTVPLPAGWLEATLGRP